MIIRLTSRAAVRIVLAGALLAAPAALAQQDGAATETAKDPVVAIVNGETIYRSDVDFARQRLPPQAQQLPTDVLFPALINGLIGSKLAAQAARRQELQKDGEHQKMMARVEDQLLERAYLMREIEARTTEEALRQQYEQHVAQRGTQEEVHARHILVETEEEAKEVIAELDKGGDFIQLAKERSTGPSGPKGGDLGFFSKDQMVAPFAEAAFAMAAGETSKAPVQTQFGWHVIKVEERRQGQPPSFAEVEDEVRDELNRTIGSEVLQELRANADIQQFGPDGKPVAP